MGRILVLAVLVAAAWWLYRRLTSAGGAAPPTEDNPGALPARRCALCGVHVPERLAERSGEYWFCSATHRLEFEDQRPGH